MTRLPPLIAILLPLAIASASAASGRDDVARSLNPLASLDKSTLKAFVEQPLFEPSRHPPAVAPSVAYVAPPAPPPTPEPPPSLRLLGLVEAAHSLLAVVHLNDTGKTETLRSGDHIGPWIAGVTTGGLRVTNGDRAYEYALFHGGSPQGPTPVTPPPAFAMPTVATRDASKGGSR